MNSNMCLRILLHVTRHSKAVRIPNSSAAFSCSNLSECLCRNLVEEDSNVQEYIGSKGTICCLRVHSILDCHQFGLFVWLFLNMQYVKGKKGVSILSHMFLLHPRGTQKELQPHRALQTSLITFPLHLPSLPGAGQSQEKRGGSHKLKRKQGFR